MSDKPKIMVCDQMADAAVAELEKYFDVDVNIGQTPEGLADTIGSYNGIIVRSATKVREPALKAALDAANLKVVVRGGVGIDNIDHEFAEANGIAVRNTPAASSVSVAELTFGMLIGCARHIGYGTHTIKNGEWLKKQLKGVELQGKTLGVVGIGRIGQEVAKRAFAFEMNVIAYDAYLNDSPMDNVPLLSLDEILEKSDFITLHIPYDPEVGPTLNTGAFAKMKDGVIIVNCARGGTIDESALVDALNSGKVYAVGLDVFETEPPTYKALLDHPRTVLTPHIGAGTVEAQAKVAGAVIDVLRDFFGV